MSKNTDPASGAPMPPREPEGSAPKPLLWKRILDLSLIAVAFPLWAPVMLLLAIGIKVVSRGPIFFTQERVGLRGRKFVCYKFRSMRHKIETASHEAHFKDLVDSDVPMTKLDAAGDSRLIPLGAILRATGLDELPQLINVLRGEMSLTGPRPCTTKEYEEFFKGRHDGRFDALPGLTGWWQVNGKNKTTFARMIELDIEYARKQSLGLDLKIMAKTFPVLVQQTLEILKRRFSGNNTKAGGTQEPKRLSFPAAVNTKLDNEY